MRESQHIHWAIYIVLLFIAFFMLLGCPMVLNSLHRIEERMDTRR